MNRIRVLLLEPGKLARVEEIGEELSDLQAVVGGYIEAAYFFDDPVALVVNEDGKINGLEPNRGIYEDDQLVDIIFGPAFLCGDSGEEFSSLSDELIEKYSELLKYPEKFYLTDEGFKGVVYDPSFTE